MFFRNLSCCIAAVAVAVPLSAFAGSLNVKPGVWEMTATTLTTGMSMPSETLSKMSPEQRAMMEKAMQAFSGKPRTIVTKNCITKEDLDDDRMITAGNEDNCTKKIISKSANRMVFEMICGAPNVARATVITEAKTPESVISSMDMVQGSGGKIHMDMKGRWLGASCEGIKGL